MNFLVTGGAGFIGSNIVSKLLSLGHKVKVLDNFSTGKRDNLVEFEGDIELIEGDIRSYHIVMEAVQDVEVILHQAALPSVPRSINDPITSNEVNITGTLNILEAARTKGVRRVVYASSSSVYGDNPALPKHEGMTPNPLSPYAVSKLAGEKYCHVFSRIYGLETVALRYFNVFGPRQDPTSQYSAVIPKFITAMKKGKQPLIHGDGTQSRDFTFIENVVDANLKSATVDCQSGLAMNCACHGRTDLNTVIKNINELIGSDVNPIYGDPRPGDIKHSFADISLIKEKIGYEPIVDFKEGLKKTIEYYE
ncbi:MAG: GDP-mannose 4,6-dehydratase [Melioribacteraceae bacterium]|nr:MAG: GDP-mannose 4,6-dehydratase [Melioribacteraceae bacterium]